MEIVPPKESMGGKLLSSFRKTVKDHRKCYDFIMVARIFILAALELISMFLQVESEVIPEEYWGYYALSTYPLLVSIAFWVVGLSFFVKILRYNSCFLTQWATILYFVMQTLNLIVIVSKWGFIWYYEWVYPFLLFMVLVLILIQLVKWCSKSLSGS